MSQTNKYPPGGVLFSNKRKTSPSHPDYTGTLEISEDLLAILIEANRNRESIKMDLSGWIKTGQSGAKFLTLAARRPYIPNQQVARPQQTQRRDDPLPNLDDEIPF